MCLFANIPRAYYNYLNCGLPKKKLNDYFLKKVMKKATKDITVYKKFDTRSGRLISPFRGLEYERGKHYYQTGVKFTWHASIIYDDGIYIERGLHAYTYAKPGCLTCIIPKGSLYLISKCGDEIVSDQLIIP